MVSIYCQRPMRSSCKVDSGITRILFTPKYIKGDRNRVADALSRIGFGNGEEQFTQEDNITSPASLFTPRESSPKFVC